MFWQPQHLRNLPELASWTRPDRERLVSRAFFIVISVSIVGNFFAGWLARAIGYRRAIAAMFLLACLAMAGSFGDGPRPRGARSRSGSPSWASRPGLRPLHHVHAALFPTLLRTTGAGFCYNIGRLVAAFGTVFFGWFAPVGDFRVALLADGALFGVAAVLALPSRSHGLTERPRRSRPGSRTSAGAPRGRRSSPWP
jgi:hypothetical protein